MYKAGLASRREESSETMIPSSTWMPVQVEVASASILGVLRLARVKNGRFDLCL